MRWLIAIALLAACKNPPPPVEPPAEKTKAKPAKAKPKPPPDECFVDTECVLVPELSCCGECPPVAPYVAVTRAELDAAFLEDEEQCAVEDWDCDAFQCTASPPGCKAKAACERGQCVVASNGC